MNDKQLDEVRSRIAERTTWQMQDTALLLNEIDRLREEVKDAVYAERKRCADIAMYNCGMECADTKGKIESGEEP